MSVIPVNIWHDVEKLWSTIYSVEMFYIVRTAEHEEMFNFVKPDIIPINIWYDIEKLWSKIYSVEMFYIVY